MVAADHRCRQSLLAGDENGCRQRRRKLLFTICSCSPVTLGESR